MLIGGWFNPWCDGFTFAKHPCNGHGTCFGAGQCKCDYSYGPDHRYDLGPNGMQLNVSTANVPESMVAPFTRRLGYTE